MAAREYAVSLKTPLGKKNGTLTVELRGESLEGYLMLHGSCETVTGTVDPAGHCALEGSYTALGRKILFQGEGTLTRSFIHLRLRSGKHTLELTGAICPDSDKVY